MTHDLTPPGLLASDPPTPRPIPMREPARIDAMLTLLSQVWQRSPDLRLGQLLVCAARPDQPCPEIFQIEDDRLAEGLRDLMSRMDASGE